ncbi:MAG: hypothetical protein AB1716_10380 [Planctomycetota bacterium]
MNAAEALRKLRWHFRRHGIVRLPNPQRQQAEPRKYHKGYEVRLLARDWRRLRSSAPGS